MAKGASAPVKSAIASTTFDKILRRALNKNQILILTSIDGSNITTLLRRLSSNHHIPVSTLKLNAKILQELELIKYADFYPTELTESGNFVLEILMNDRDE